MNTPSDAGSDSTRPTSGRGSSSSRDAESERLRSEIFEDDVEGDSTRQMSLDEISEMGRQRSSEDQPPIPPAPVTPPQRPANPPASAFPPPAPPAPPAPPTVAPGAPAGHQYTPNYARPSPAGAPTAAAVQAHPTQEGGQKDRRRTPWAAITFAVVTALVLVGGGLYIFFDMQSSDDEVDRAAPPPVSDSSSSPEEEQSDEPDDGDSDFDASEAEAFITPSGNISCVIYKDRARCTVYDYDYSPGDAPADCTGGASWGSVAEVTKKSSGFSCDSLPEGPSPKQLAYGKTIKAHGFECSSQKDGVRCKGEGGSFHVRKGDYSFS